MRTSSGVRCGRQLATNETPPRRQPTVVGPASTGASATKGNHAGHVVDASLPHERQSF